MSASCSVLLSAIVLQTLKHQRVNLMSCYLWKIILLITNLELLAGAKVALQSERLCHKHSLGHVFIKESPPRRARYGITISLVKRGNYHKNNFLIDELDSSKGRNCRRHFLTGWQEI